VERIAVPMIIDQTVKIQIILLIKQQLIIDQTS